MPRPHERLLAVVGTWRERLARLDEPDAARPIGAGWSTKEVVGHLVDSAQVNLERFLRARDTDHIDLPGYPQDEWVAAGGYATAPWPELLDLWSLLNRQVARVMERTDEDALTRERRRHSLDRIAWRPVPAGEPTTLATLMADYVDHLEHHLNALGS